MLLQFRFQSTRPGRGATAGVAPGRAGKQVSIHAPRTGRDLTLVRNGVIIFAVSIHAPRTGRDQQTNQKLIRDVKVSIHAPRTGRDKSMSPLTTPTSGFNPRAPDGARPAATARPVEEFVFQSTRPGRGATLTDSKIDLIDVKFQSTRPGRGATVLCAFSVGDVSGFNPRAPDGARRGVDVFVSVAAGVSIHAPRTGRDCRWFPSAREYLCFNPRAPDGARHSPTRLRISNARVSIHAPRTGRDSISAELPITGTCFNPRAPDGARHQCAHHIKGPHRFQSTRPGRGATSTNSFRASNIVSFQSTRPGRGATSAASLHSF